MRRGLRQTEPHSDGYVEVIGILTGICDAIVEPYSGDPAGDTDLSAQILTLPASDRYSYIFEGSAQALDHTLTSPALGTFLRGFVYVRGNADAPERLQNDPTTFLRSSDHDGAVLFVMSDADGDGTPDDRDDCPASDHTRR